MLNKTIFNTYKNIRIIFFRLLSTQKIEGPATRVQAVQSMGAGTIRVKGRVSIGYFPSPHFFSTYAYIEARTKDACIEIGQGTTINNGFVAIAEHSKIEIGENCLIGTRVEIYDSDFHSLSADDRANGVRHTSRSVYIGNNVFIGSNVKILKGVHIGDGAVIANGAVVTRDVPENHLASGVPAKNIRRVS